MTLWTLELEFSNAEYFGKVDVGGVTTLEALRFTLESNDILDWRFDFWDIEDKRRVRNELERLNGFSKQIHVICVGEGEINANKRRRVEHYSFLISTTEAGDAVDDVQVLEVGGDDLIVALVGSSRMSGPTDSAKVDNNPRDSQLLPTDAMDHYLEKVKKLRLELKWVALDDHDWWLKTFDLNGSGVVKLWCAKCKKDYGWREQRPY